MKGISAKGLAPYPLVFSVILGSSLAAQAWTREPCDLRLVHRSGPEEVVAQPTVIRIDRDWAGVAHLTWKLDQAVKAKTDAFQAAAVGNDIGVYLGEVAIMDSGPLHEHVRMTQISISLQPERWARYQPKLARCAQVDLSALTPLPVDTTGLFETDN